MEHAKSKETNENNWKALSRKEKEFLQRRRLILDAALSLFSAKGYAGTSMQEIALASEFSIGTLYNFFETKESLYLTIVEEKFIQSREKIEAEVAGAEDCMEKIGRAVYATLAFMEENRDFFNIFLGIGSVPEPAVHGGIYEKLIKYYQEHVRFFQELMEEGLDKGLFRDFSSLELALSLIGNCNATIHDWLIGPGEASLVVRHKRILDMFFRGSLRRREGKRKR